LALLFLYAGLNAQVKQLKHIPAGIDFGVKISDWDGFGFNYVETAQTRDYSGYQQDYGGFSLLSTEQKAEILEMIFGPEGLQVQIVKMFLDPYHQPEPGGKFFHETTTRNMLFFVDEGLRLTRERGMSWRSSPRCMVRLPGQQNSGSSAGGTSMSGRYPIFVGI